jgi:sodium transport system ATP-binding protein
MIVIENLTKRYGESVAVDGLSFEARDGEITGLLGANGAGKTTTLRIIAGVLTPQAGRVGITGGPGSLGALLDHAGLYGRLTARENIEYFGRLRSLSSLDQRVDEVIGRLGLSAIADRRVAGFSMGERMKVALGRALVHDPRNLLLDEPTNGLDIPTVRSLRELLRGLRDRGHAIVFSSHVLDEVRLLCDRVVVIVRGVVAADGTPEQLCRQTGRQSLEDAYLQLAGAREATTC